MFIWRLARKCDHSIKIWWKRKFKIRTLFLRNLFQWSWKNLIPTRFYVTRMWLIYNRISWCHKFAKLMGYVTAKFSNSFLRLCARWIEYWTREIYDETVWQLCRFPGTVKSIQRYSFKGHRLVKIVIQQLFPSAGCRTNLHSSFN